MSTGRASLIFTSSYEDLTDCQTVAVAFFNKTYKSVSEHHVSCLCSQGPTGFPGSAGRVGPPGPTVSAVLSVNENTFSDHINPNIDK